MKRSISAITTALICLVMSCAFASELRQPALATTPSQVTPDSVSATAVTGGVKASYAGQFYVNNDARNGHMDIPAMITRLQALHVNTYVYLLANWNAGTGYNVNMWNDLAPFVVAAEAAHINVWVTLTPPSENGTAIWGNDYVAASREVAKIRAQHPNLQAIVIDDFDSNATNANLFTPDYLRKMRAQADAIAPGMKFYPTVYFHTMNATYAAKYNPVVDGYVFPFRDDPLRNTVWSANAAAQINTYQQIVGARSVFLMPYASFLASTPYYPADEDYVDKVTRAGLNAVKTGAIEGIVQYQLMLAPNAPYGHLSKFTLPSHRPDPATNRLRPDDISIGLYVPKGTATGNTGRTTPLSWAAMNTKVTLNPGSTSCTVQAWYRKDIGEGMPKGYHLLTINVSNASGKQVIFQKDAAEGLASTWQANADLQLCEGRAGDHFVLPVRPARGRQLQGQRSFRRSHLHRLHRTEL